MLLFCPACANMLVASRVRAGPDQGRNRFECRTCPYQFVIETRYSDKKELPRKEVEDVIGGKEAWANADKTQVQCTNTKCESTEAYFYQLQIRSADEPMTSFFKCVLCAKQWRE